MWLDRLRKSARRRDERREHERHDAPVEVHIVGEGAGYRQVMDINGRGLRMTSDELLNTGEWIPIRLRATAIESTEEMALLGRVAWTEETGELGLDLRHLDKERACRLEQMISGVQG